MRNHHKNSLKAIPSIQDLLVNPAFNDFKIDAHYLKKLITKNVDRYREQIIYGGLAPNLDRDQLKSKIIKDIVNEIEVLLDLNLKPVINATGIILHTNLGRAPYPATAKNYLNAIVDGYCNLEINLDSGRRGDRNLMVEKLICFITGAEAAVITNNNAAAVFLVLNSLCKRKEVPVSRGELVEIGGSFRMPEVMKASGAKMVEIGTTNITKISDYTEAINTRTGGLLKVHSSNYRILGFAQSVQLLDLVKLTNQHNLPLIYDMGSGVLEDLQQWGYPHEPVASEYVDIGVDVISFSGDKVLGGPQSGIIIGKNKYLQKIKKNHLLRALRCDKMTIAILESTLKLYLNPSQLPSLLPVAKILTTTLDDLKCRGQKIIDNLNHLPLSMELYETFSEMGSGALPLEKIPSIALKIQPENMSVTKLAKRLRSGSPVLLGYIENDCLMLNLRTIAEEQLDSVVHIFKNIFN